MSARIIKIIRLVNKKTYGVAYVQLDDGSEAEIFIGGDVETFYDERYNKVKAVIKRAQSRN
jgi:hypothetical protein